jgi:ferritin-like metal-binding protein YciE
MASLDSPEDLLITEIKEIHSAERQLSRALPRLAKQINSPRLREMLEQRRDQGASLIERIEDALDEMDAARGRTRNIVAEALIDSLNEHIDSIQDDVLLDPLVLASVQKIEHYCISAWGAAAAIGRLLGENNVVKTMEQVLGEGKKFDAELTKLAEEEINPRLLDEDDEDEYEDEDEDDENDEKVGEHDRKKATAERERRSRAKQH